MLLVNQKQLTEYPEDSLIRKEYQADIEDIKREYPDQDYLVVKLTKTPPPDSSGNVYPVPPFAFPLISKHESEDGSSNIWAYCKVPPELKPNGLWEPKKKNRILENGTMLVDMKRDLDFAVYLLKKSQVFKGKFLEIDDPGREARKRGAMKRKEALIYSLVWGELEDEKELRTLAAAWGLPNSEREEPDLLREKLEGILRKREKDIERGKKVKGLEFLMDMRKDKDRLMTRSVIQKAIDKKIIAYDKKERRYMIADSEIMVIPVKEAENHFEYFADSLNKHKDELLKVLKHFVDEDFIDSLREDYSKLQWLAKVNGTTYAGRKGEEIAKELKDAFCA